MGKIQCISLRATNETWNRIENDLNQRTSDYERRIFQEFNFLRENLTSQYRRTTEKLTQSPSSQGYYFDKITAKIYTSSQTVSLRKRMRRFIKWYKMSTDQDAFFDDSKTKGGKSPEELVKPIHTKRSSNASLSSFMVNLKIEYEDKIEGKLCEAYKYNPEKFAMRVFKGPPDCFRWKSWNTLKCGEKLREEIFLNLFSQPTDETIDSQIKKDINRTLTQEPQFNSEKAQTSLYRVLKAFANLDKKVSYCQGMNFLVGFLLIQSEFNEVESFYMLVKIFEGEQMLINNQEINSITQYSPPNLNIRGFFLSDFPTLKFSIFLFETGFAKRMPNLHHHFSKIEIPNEVWISKWLQTLFTISLPLHAVVRLWDCLIAFGAAFLINFSLAIIKLKEEDLQKLEEAFDIVDFFKSYLNNENLDVEEIIIQAQKFPPLDAVSLGQYKKEFEAKHQIDLSKFDIKYDLAKPIVSQMESQSAIRKGDLSLDSLSSYGDFINSKIECEEEVITSQKDEVVQKQINSLDNANFSLLLKTTKNTETAISKIAQEGILINLSETQKEKDEIEESVSYEVDVEETHLDSKVNGYKLTPIGMSSLR